MKIRTKWEIEVLLGKNNKVNANELVSPSTF